MKTHTGVKDLDCSYTSARRLSLKQHKTMNHGGDKSDKSDKYLKLYIQSSNKMQSENEMKIFCSAAKMQKI